MRSIRRTYRQSRGGSRGDSTSFWLSFSDLMSALLLIFILIMFYIMYQYFEMYEISMAEIARQQYDLDQANQELSAQQEKLTASEQAMVAQQIKLNAAQADLTDAESILASQQEELASAQNLLDEKETEIASQQASLDQLSGQLTAQQTQLDQQQARLSEQETQIDTQQRQLQDQQVQLEQLVGIRTRIISTLSAALKENSISAAVDTETGAITLKSDVLFETGRSELSEEGCRQIDDFLPVYLNVLFSEEYSPYVSEIIIEGHTDSTGTYLMNLALSQSRALAVASYVLSDGYAAITQSQREKMRQIATANGRSESDPILVDGAEDMNASRRVVFKFRLTDEQMIAQLQQILEAD